MLKIPSINTVWKSLRNILIRFPLQSLIALFAMSLWLSVADSYANDYVNLINKLIALSLVAFTSSLSVALFAESRKVFGWKSWAMQLLIIGASYSIALCVYPEYFKTDVLKIILLILTGHLLVSISPYLNKSDPLTLWNFNKTLFLHFLTSVLFSVILYIGLAVALFTTETLFQIDYNGDIYFKLFIIISVGFNTLFFLYGVPPNLNELPMQNAYPKGLKFFIQYVLIPLIVIYLAILLVYELRIVFSMQLPDGMVAVLIMGYAALGILSYLLIYPIRNDSGQAWVNHFSRLFFWFMLPLLILLFIAIAVRIQDYGITEMRYFVFALALWLTFLTLYFITIKEPNIKIIPTTLIIIILLGVIGPFSASILSKGSQQSRLTDYMVMNNDTAKLGKASAISYLVEYYGMSAVQGVTNQNLIKIQREILADDSTHKSNYYIKKKLKDTTFSLLGVNQYNYPHQYRYVNFTNQEKVISNNDFDYVFWIEYNSLDQEFESPIGPIKISKVYNSSIRMEIKENTKVIFDINDLRTKLAERYKSQLVRSENTNIALQTNKATAPSDLMLLEVSNNQYEVKIHVQQISFDVLEENPSYATPFSGFVLIKKVDPLN